MCDIKKAKAEVETPAVKYGEAQAELERAEVKRDEAEAECDATCVEAEAEYWAECNKAFWDLFSVTENRVKAWK